MAASWRKVSLRDQISEWELTQQGEGEGRRRHNSMCKGPEAQQVQGTKR